MLRTIHGRLEFLAHRHNSKPPPPTSSPTLSREAAAMCTGNDSPSFYFVDTIFTAADFIFSITLLLTIHRGQEFSSHRHNSEPPPPTSCPPLSSRCAMMLVISIISWQSFIRTIQFLGLQFARRGSVTVLGL